MLPTFLSARRCRRLLLLLALGATATILRAADPRPISVQDLCLMLRSGYTGGEVLQETANRPLLEPLTPEAEKSLRAAGADTSLVSALRNSRPALSPAESVLAHQRLAAEEQRAAAIQQAETSRPPLPAAPSAAPTAGSLSGDPHTMENVLHGKLVTFVNGSFRPLDLDSLAHKRVFGLYFSTYVSAPGRKFAPELVAFYRRMQSLHPEFEVVAFSHDRSVYDMENMMRSMQMPWPAVAFDQLARLPMLTQFFDPNGASRLVVADNTGRVLADYAISQANPNVAQVLPDLEKVIADPTHPSALAPPHAPAPGPGARGTQ